MSAPAKGTAAKSRRKRAEVRGAALSALEDLLEPLAGFVLDAGLNAQEFQSLLRVAAVRSAAGRQRETKSRINISGIAASTGISRAEVSRILKTPSHPRPPAADTRLHATNRVLAVWHDDPKYTDGSGQPADLKIYGKPPSFDSLVKRHGRGLPTRAMLDELLRTDSVEITGAQRVRAKTFFAVDRGLSPGAVKAFGDRATELLSTMLSAMRDPRGGPFISHLEGPVAAPGTLPILRREAASRSETFLAGMRDILFAEPVAGPATDAEPKRPRVAGDPAKDAPRISLTVFFHEEAREPAAHKPVVAARQNLRRAP